MICYRDEEADCCYYWIGQTSRRCVVKNKLEIKVCITSTNINI